VFVPVVRWVKSPLIVAFMHVRGSVIKNGFTDGLGHLTALHTSHDVASQIVKRWRAVFVLESLALKVILAELGGVAVGPVSDLILRHSLVENRENGTGFRLSGQLIELPEQSDRGTAQRDLKVYGGLCIFRREKPALFARSKVDMFPAGFDGLGLAGATQESQSPQIVDSVLELGGVPQCLDLRVV
jgi:hypothetical protein